MRITSTLFDAFLHCPTKYFLRSVGETGTGHFYADWVRGQNESYRDEAIRRLRERAAPDEYVTGPLIIENLKTAKWRVATDLVVRTQHLESVLHAVERVPSRGQSKHSEFIPIRFVSTNKLTHEEKLLLAFDALVLSELLGREPGFGRIIHGDKDTTTKVNVSGLVNKVRTLTGRIAALLSSDSPPELVLNRHCAVCEFQARCRQKVIEKDDLSLISGMSEKERKAFNNKGIFTVTQLSYTFRPRRRPRQLVKKREKYHHSIKALAIRERKIHVVGRPELNIEGTPIYLDVEGIPDRDFYYLIGVRVKTGKAVVQHSLWADSADQEKQIWTAFLNVLSAIEDPILIHYGSFETVFMKRMCERYGAPADRSVPAVAIKSAVNLLSMIYARIYFPTFSNGLKEIAGYLGFRWSDSTASGLQTIAWRHEWVASKNSTIKQELMTYNANDCEALELVTSKLIALQKVFSPDEREKPTDVVDTATLKREHPYGFKRNTFVLPELDAINKAAYWDYQRQRIYVKSNAHVKHALRRAPTTRKVPSPNKVIECPPPRSCPKCNGLNLSKRGKASKTVLDLRFMRHGVKRWITRYQFHRYTCKGCGVTFFPPEKLWTRDACGSEMIAYALYQNIELRLPQKSVDRSMSKLFGFPLALGRTSGFKTKGAQIYRETYEALVKRVCSGHLVHVDETKISVKGRDGVVWVFASMEEVAYVYSESRQGDTLQTLLKGFTGVLVSDFYAAYDGIPCRQQKCLIHLIRDLNDEVLKHPYDEELKHFAKCFADLLRPMVETVDRYGLKSRFLRRHIMSVKRFYKQLSMATPRSEPATKCKQRFEKNRETLFTFLEYDGVPWNNNNAEHAIKAFATLRHVIKGVTTEKGLRDYLVLLSLCETCKYKGLSFLDFLRSGETDIGEFGR